MKFYTSFFRNGNKVHVRGYNGNRQFFDFFTLEPAHYIVDPDEYSPTLHTSFYGDKLQKVQFDSAWDAHKFCKENKDIDIFGYPNYEYSRINEEFKDQEYDTALLRTAVIDIETLVGNDQDGNPEVYDAFPNILDPQHSISLITTLIGKNLYCYGLDYHIDEASILKQVKDNLPEDFDFKSINFEFKQYANDTLLLADFITLIQIQKPDIITGWNSNGFDIPYICKRIENLYGEKAVNRLSPFKMVDSKMVNKNFGKQGLDYSIKGIELLDYLELYKKFELSPRENYKLETIAQIELGMGKLDYEGSFQNFYKTDWSKFVAYNIIDVLLVSELDKKLAFIEIAAGMAYSSMSVFTDVFRVTRIWDNIIANYCALSNIQVPTDYSNERSAYQGAYVKPTIPGKYGIVAAFDVGSLYPSLIVENNISPERILPEDEFIYISPQDIIDMTDRYTDAFANAVSLNATLSANGALFDKSIQGIIPQLVEIYMMKRKTAKKSMANWGTKLEHAKARLQSLT